MAAENKAARARLVACSEPFDERQRDSCNGGQYVARFYYDSASKVCRSRAKARGFTRSSVCRNAFAFITMAANCHFPPTGFRTKRRAVKLAYRRRRQVCATDGRFSRKKTIAENSFGSVPRSRGDQPAQQLPPSPPSPTSTRTPIAHPAAAASHAHRPHNRGPHRIALAGATTIVPQMAPSRSGDERRGAQHKTKQKTMCANENSRLDAAKSPPPTNENICERAQPCRNSGICIFDKQRRSYVCECANGWKGKNCEYFDCKLRFLQVDEKSLNTPIAANDPCARLPCKNGATCTNARNKTTGAQTFDCFCAAGFGGERCELSKLAMSGARNSHASSAI